MKKLKSEHSNLTSNDLRLCTYLRLNLSSKEIAPLLNISIRGVEVKKVSPTKKDEFTSRSQLKQLYIRNIIPIKTIQKPYMALTMVCFL